MIFHNLTIHLSSFNFKINLTKIIHRYQNFSPVENWKTFSLLLFKYLFLFPLLLTLLPIPLPLYLPSNPRPPHLASSLCFLLLTLNLFLFACLPMCPQSSVFNCLEKHILVLPSLSNHIIIVTAQLIHINTCTHNVYTQAHTDTYIHRVQRKSIRHSFHFQ